MEIEDDSIHCKYCGERVLALKKITIEDKVYLRDNVGVRYREDYEMLLKAPVHIEGTYNILPGTKTIGESAFRECIHLKGVTIPWSVNMIMSNAFEYCYGLTDVIIPDRVTDIPFSAFSGCYGLKEVTIPNSVTTIGNDAFRDCLGLTSVTIPNSVTTIGSRAFQDCTGLTSITIGNSVTEIGEQAFYGCTGLTKVTIGNSVKKIGKNAFRDCSGLTEITIPNSVTTIGENAFYGCKVLKEITLGDKVHTIGNYAFAFCSGMMQATILNRWTEIGRNAFWCCTGLKKITIPFRESRPIIYATTRLSIAAIGGFPSEGTMPTYTGSAIKEMSVSILGGCTGLTEVAFCNGVIEITSHVLFNSLDLTKITIPESVLSIRNGAFRRCAKLKSITILNPNPPRCDSSVFLMVDKSSCTLYVPKGSRDAYSTNEWWGAFRNIRELE